MHLIDHSTAAAGNQFTDGNKGTGIPSTRVTAKWLNSIQNELANFITSKGIVLDDGNVGQLAEAIMSAVQDTSSAPFSLGNNLTVFTNVTGLILDKTITKSAVIVLDVYRKTATLEYSTIVTLKPIYFPILNKWKLLPVKEESTGDFSGVTFAIDENTGQISCISSNMAGGSYDGNLRYKINRINFA